MRLCSGARAALAAHAALAAAAAAAAAPPTALAASASAAVAVPAATNCSRERHIRIGVFDEATPHAVAFLTGWMDEHACWSFHQLPTGTQAIELLATGSLQFAVIGDTPLATAIARGLDFRVYQRVHVHEKDHGLVVRNGIAKPQDLRGITIMLPELSTAHYIVLLALREYGIDGSDVTIEFADPLVIREAWDAGLIDGAGCWGNTLHHLLHNPHGGNNVTGHLIMDAATVRRWGYATTNKLVTTVATLFELEQDQIGNGATNFVQDINKYFARANYDYRFRPRPLPGAPQGPWGWNGTYNRLVRDYVSLVEESDVSLLDIEERMGKREYPTVLENDPNNIDERARKMFEQAYFVYEQKRLATPPTLEQFKGAEFSPCTNAASLECEITKRAVMDTVAFEKLPLDEAPYPLPITSVALVQKPVAGEVCGPYELLNVTDAAPATFSDGSTGTNAYHSNTECVWAIRSASGCITLDLPFLSMSRRSMDGFDRVEAFSSNGWLLGSYTGRRMSDASGVTTAQVPKFASCVEPGVGLERREEIVRALAGPHAPVDGEIAMYVKWTSDKFDELVVGTVLEPVGFLATAEATEASPSTPCPPGYAGATCDYPACYGLNYDSLLYDLGRSGTIRSQPVGKNEYAPYSRCAWLIAVGEDATHVKFTFKTLGLELGFDQFNLYEAEVVEKFGLGDAEAREAVRRDYAYRTSGDRTPEESIIIAGDVFVQFESDGMINAPPGGGEAGFELEWSLVNYVCPGETGVDGACICPLGRYGLNCALKSCVGVAPRVSQSTGRIKSGIADDYLPDNTCLWQVDLPGSATAGQLQAVALRFSTFDLERLTTDSAVSDVVEVYEVPNGEKAFRSKLTEYQLLQSFDQGEFERGIYDIGRPEKLEFTGGTANGTSIAIVFSTDMNNPQPHSGFELTYSGVYGGEPFCSDENWPCDNEFECIDGVCTLPTSSPRGSKKGNREFPKWAEALLIALVCLLFLALVWLAIYVRRARKNSKLAAKSEALLRERMYTVQEQVQTAMERVEELQVVRGDDFLALGALTAHETMVERAQIVVFHTVNQVRKAQASGLIFLFLSHQWLGWSEPDPDGAHYAAMCSAIKAVADESGVDVSAIRVWVDFASIPQANRAEQRLSITSLPAFSACCDAFVVVAPNATHASTGNQCDCASYQRRAWCRAEIMSFWARHGSSNMHVLGADGSFGPLDLSDEATLVSTLGVFQGELTCCRLGHPRAQPCDKEELVLPILGLLAHMYRDHLLALRSSDGLELSKTSMAAGAFDLIAPHLDVLFPKTFEWEYTPDGTQIVETSPLFGDLVEAVKYAVEVEMAAEDDPIFQRAAPIFEPGTHARRRIHVRARYEKRRSSGETDTSSPSRAHGGGHMMPRRGRPALHGMHWRSFRRDPDAQHPHGAPGEIDEP